MLISHINLVGFYQVLLQIMQFNCVQQSSISTWVYSSTFTRGQLVCVSLLVARGRHCYAEWAIRWALPHISSFLFLVVDLGATSSQELLNGSSSTFQELVELCKGLINFASILAIAQGTLPWQPIKVARLAFLRKKNHHCHTTISKRIGISER